VAALSFLLLWAGITGFPLFVCTALAGLAFGGEGDVLAYFVSRLFGCDSFGRIYSVLLMINLLGGVVGPYIFGAAFDATGSYTTILAGTTAATLTAAALILCVRNRAPAALAQGRFA
jgi:cyanate permease